MSEQSGGTVNLDHLQADQEVYGSDGRKIGKVAGILQDLDTGEPYLAVTSGLFKDLYVPRSAISYAVLGQPVRLTVEHDYAVEHFSFRPNVL